MIKILQEFLENLQIAGSGTLTFIAFGALLLLTGWWLYKKYELSLTKTIISNLNDDQKINYLEKKFNRQIDPARSPQEWLKERTMRYWVYIAVSFLGSLIVIVSMAIFSKTNGSIKTYNFSTLSNSNIEEKAKELINNYLKSLTDESFEGKKFFADDVERFFRMQYTTATNIENYIKAEYYPNFLNRKIYSLPSTWELVEKKNDYCVFTLEIEGSWVSKKYMESVHTKTKMRLKINENLKIVHWNEIKILYDSRKH